MPSKTPATFADRLCALRTAAGLSRYALGQLADVDDAFIGHLENGTKQPSWAVVVKLADALDVSVSEFCAKRSGGRQ